MRVTFDAGARAFYFYFTEAPPGTVKETFVDVLVDVHLTAGDEIAGLTVLNQDEDGERLSWADKLEHIGDGHLDGEFVRVEFPSAERTRTLRWICNVDIDDRDQVMGIEILFAERVLPPPTA